MSGPEDWVADIFGGNYSPCHSIRLENLSERQSLVIHSFNRYLLSIYCVTSTSIITWDTSSNKTDEYS